MAEKKIYIGSAGPYLYDDADPIDDPDGDFSGKLYGGLTTNGDISCTGLNVDSIKLNDLNASNILSIIWNEDDTSDRILNLLLSDADRSLTISGDSEIDQSVATTGTPTFVDLILSTPTYSMFNLSDPGVDGIPQWNFGTSSWEWTVAGITDFSGFTTDDLTEGITNLYFPGFTSLSTDYGFTDNSSNWNTAYGWGNHALAGYLLNITGESVFDLSDFPYDPGADGYLFWDDSAGAMQWVIGYPNFPGVYINETSNAKMTTGLTINQGAADDEIFALKSSDVSHPFTSIAESDTFCEVLKNGGDQGGLKIRGFSDSDWYGIGLQAFIGVTSVTLNPLIFQASKSDGGSSNVPLANTEPFAAFLNYTTALMTLNGLGAMWVKDNVSALSFTDRTPFYEGDALVEIMNIKGKNGEIDHLSLPEFAVKKEVIFNTETKQLEEYRERDLGAMLSVHDIAIQRLIMEVNDLKLKGGYNGRR